MATTIQTLIKLKEKQQRFASLSCYDASFAAVAAAAEIEVLLVGDSLGMVIQGQSSTLPVTVNDICYHTRAVASSNNTSLIMADMPFMGSRTIESTLENAMALMQAGAHIVKLEGNAWLAKHIKQLKQQGVPVCAHLGLTPQHVNAFGGFKVQAKNESDADQLIATARELESAGADIILVECIPSKVTKQLYSAVQVPIIGIGAGPECDGQILVLYDILDIPAGKKAKFVKNYLAEAQSIESAMAQFRAEVVSGAYPSLEHSFS